MIPKNVLDMQLSLKHTVFHKSWMNLVFGVLFKCFQYNTSIFINEPYWITIAG